MAADVWGPLLAIADHAGGAWRKRARAAARELSPADERKAHLRDVRDRGGVSLVELARFMGTSVEQIDRTYGHCCRTHSEDERSAQFRVVEVSSRTTAEA
jgi:Protein of unknown function (DUF3631)